MRYESQSRAMTEELLLVTVYILAGGYPLMNRVWISTVHSTSPVAVNFLGTVSS
jgi:hypothetical protein